MIWKPRRPSFELRLAGKRPGSLLAAAGLAALVTLGILIPTSPAVAQVAELVLELAPGEADATIGHAPSAFYPLGQRLVFYSGFPRFKQDLWVTEGTPATTRILADFNAGVVGQAGGFVYFVSDHDDPAFAPNNLWRTDGTLEGTRPVLEEAAFLAPERIPGVALGDVLVFGTNTRLWSTDGTAEGTEVLAQYFALRGLQAYGPDRAVVASDPVLRITDGTAAGTRILHEASVDLQAVAVSGARIFLKTRERIDDENRSVLWVFDSPESPPRALALPASLSVFATEFLPAEPGAVLFTAQDRTTNDQDLWRTDGTEAGTRRLSDLPEGHFIESFWHRQGTTWLHSGVARGGGAFWRIEDGPASQTELFPACGPAGCNEVVGLIRPFGDHFFIRGSRGPGTPPTWLTNGSAGDLRPLKSLCHPQCAGIDRSLLPAGDELFFFGETASGQYRLYLTDGTRAGTRVVAPLSFDVEPPLSGAVRWTSGDGASEDWVLGLNALGKGREPWLYSADSDALRLLADAGRSPVGLAADHLTASGDGLSFLSSPFSMPFSRSRDAYRLARNGPPVKLTDLDPDSDLRLEGAAGRTFLTETVSFLSHRLWQVGESPEDSAVLATLETQPSPLVGWQGKAFFTVKDGPDLGLWVSDGTTAGTKRVFDPAGQGFESFSRVVLGEDGLYYLTIDVDDRLSLWRSDGTEDGTGLLGELGTERDSSLHLGKPAIFDGATYFLVCRFRDQVLWRLPEGGGPLEEVAEAGFCAAEFQVNPLFDLGSRLVFLSGKADEDAGLWALEPGLDDVVPLLTSPFFNGFLPQGVQLGDRLVFTFADPATGLELWVTDGTEAGTGLLREIFPSYNSSAPHDLVEVGGLAYFAARDPGHGEELWVTDGTAAGTRLVHDLWPGPRGSVPEELTVVGDRLYFTADDGLRGRELWALPLNGGPACQATEEALCLRDGRFRVEARWRDFQGEEGPGQAAELTSDTGYFWFFDEENVEAVLKVLDGRTNNDHFWTFYGALSNVEYWLTVTDAETGLSRRYYNPPRGFASVGDTFSFGPKGASLAASPEVHEALPAAGPEVLRSRASASEAAAAANGTCAPSSERLCLGGGRFAVEVNWERPQGETGTGKAVDLTDDTGYFWFFRETNVELILKVLDGTANNGHHWVFYGSLSNVDFDVTVTDTLTGEVRTYLNRGRQFASVGDTEAFPAL